MSYSTTSSPVITTFCPAQNDACALYRHYIPHLNIENSRYFFESGLMAFSRFCESHVVVVQRQATKENFQAIKLFKQYGMKVVYDLDDDIWNIPSHNPGARIFKAMREGFEYCLKSCDLLTVSTRGLKKAVTTILPGLKVPIAIIPNAIDFRLFAEPLIERDDRCVIGWSGSATHDHDIADVWQLLPEFINKHENVWLEIIGGAEIPSKLKGHPRVMKRPWCSVAEYPRRCTSWGWDVFLVPIEDTRFNGSKSNIKMLEATAMGAVPLVSDVAPYNEFCSLNPGLRFLLCNSMNDWEMKLDRLVSEPDFRKHLVKECRKVTEEYFLIDVIKENWKYWFKELCR